MGLTSGIKLLYVASISLAVALIFSNGAASGASVQPQDIDYRNEAHAKEFLRRYNDDYARLSNKYVIADWNYNTNLTKENSDKANELALELSKFNALAFEEASKFNKGIFSADVRRQLNAVGSASLSDDEMKRLNEILSEMGELYGSEKVCLNATECLPLEPDLTDLLASTKEPIERRKQAWAAWHDTLGTKFRPLYIEYTALKNKLAKVHGYQDYGEELRERYGKITYDEDVKELYCGVLPLYKQLHAYVRRRLNAYYGINQENYLQQHLLGDMWGRFWVNLYSIAVPYPGRPSLDITENLQKQNYTVRKMFETAEEFYLSLGLQPLPPTFFNLSMLEKPADREVVCHATAWDFYDAKDFRIKMCTKLNFDDFLTIHHEMGHIQYFMQYSNQPTVYRDGANDGFHEAIGELMSMCVSTPKHLYAIGLLEDKLEDEEIEINYLFSQAITTVSAMPFHYLNDLWRWQIFKHDSTIPEANWNTEFWNLARQITGVEPPVARNDESVLDCPTIFHVAQDYDMIRYFTRTVLQFQFANSLCDAAGHEGALNECDFYGSLAAGDKLASMLKLGSSKPWEDALESLTGVRGMTAEAIKNYFAKLTVWLEKKNTEEGNIVGWGGDDYCA